VSAGPYVVKSDTSVVWDGNTTFVRRGTVVEIDPASALGTAYGGPSNLDPLRANETGDDADHADLGN
jgi:hypothetical protein